MNDALYNHYKTILLLTYVLCTNTSTYMEKKKREIWNNANALWLQRKYTDYCTVRSTQVLGFRHETDKTRGKKKGNIKMTSIQRSNTLPEVVCRVEEGAQAQVREGWIYKTK